MNEVPNLHRLSEGDLPNLLSHGAAPSEEVGSGMRQLKGAAHEEAAKHAAVPARTVGAGLLWLMPLWVGRVAVGTGGWIKVELPQAGLDSV